MAGSPQQLGLQLETHRNHYLFSDYYLDNLLPKRGEWQRADREARAAMEQLQAVYAAFTPTQNEAQTERDWIRPVLEALNHVFEVQPSIATPDGVRRPDYVFFPTQEARDAAKPLQGQEDYPATALAVGDAKHWDRSLDQTLKGDGRKASDPFTNRNPSWQIHFYMQHSGCPWGILTNGLAWRLYQKDTAHKLNYYYEVDLPALLGHGDLEVFKYFYLFFRQPSFIPNGAGRTWLDLILQESRDYAQGVGEDLKEQVYEALRHVAQGFLDYPGNDLAHGPEALKAIYDNSLILLYRLLFILYAESRELLPVHDNQTYGQTYSLDAIKKEIKGTPSKSYLRTSHGYWARLQDLFAAINQGSDGMGVPAYNGDLFDPYKHPFLAQYVVGDHELRQAIDLLARTDTKEGRVFVDYRDLEVRHLGSIYEGLLEYQLRYAAEDLAAVQEKGGERYVPAGEGQEVAVPDGRAYLVTDRGERKATGSYYTPDYIVKYIVEQTVQPLLDEASARWAERKGASEEELVDDILSLDVLDPAMGSGHFLVEATEHIARYLVVLGLQATAGMGGEPELDYWKRRVVQSCIYGVDLNPLAVELAKLSLWLATVSKDKPLSFLDHHLRCGNSLIGAWVADLGAGPVAKKRRHKAEKEVAAGQLSMFDDDAFRQHMMTAVDSMWLIERTRSDDLTGVKEQERLYQQLRDELTRRYRRLADLWTARYFGAEYDGAMWSGLLGYATGRAAAQVPQYEALLQQASAVAEEKRFFHWELEFPEVFFDRFGRPLKEQAGFDAVVGNPPYGYRLIPSDQEKSYLARYESHQYDFENYVYFTELGIKLICGRGRQSYIIPHTYLSAVSMETFRRFLLEKASIREIFYLGLGIFEGVTIESVIQTVEKGSTDAPIVVRILADGSRELTDPRNETYRMPRDRFGKSDDLVFNIYLSAERASITDKMDSCSLQLEEATYVTVGINTGYIRDVLVSNKQEDHRYHRMITGRNVARYVIDWEGEWICYDPELVRGYGSKGRTLPPEYIFARPKLLLQRTRRGLERKLVAALDDEAFYNLNRLSNVVLCEPPDYSLSYFLSLLNASLLDRYFNWVFSEYEVKPVHLRRLPMRRIAYITPQEERARLGEVGITEATEFTEHTEGADSVSFDAFRASAFGRWLDTRLATKRDGSPDTKHEQSDVVHDLLAHLAEQMIELNKQKQAEVRGFLDWLGDYTGLAVDDWSLKTYVQAYWQHPWSELQRALHQNRSKMERDVEGRQAHERIKGEFELSREKLRPLLARIAATDRLIDLIVYRLYGLTEEEVDVVEGE